MFLDVDSNRITRALKTYLGCLIATGLITAQQSGFISTFHTGLSTSKIDFQQAHGEKKMLVATP